MPGQRYRSRAHRQQRGAAAVEFALIVLPLMLILFGILQYGLYFWAKQAGSAAVRDGARRLAVAPNCTNLDGYVKTRVGQAVATWGSATVAVTNAEGNTSSATEVGDVVTLTVKFNAIDLNLPLIPFVADGLVKETAQTRVENVPATAVVC